MNGWTERDAAGRVWLCWYEPMRDPRESRSILTRTLIGVPSGPAAGPTTSKETR